MCYSPLYFLHFSSAQLPSSIDAEVAVAAFQSQRDVLLTAIHSCLTEVANKLLAKFVISPEMFDKARNSRNESRERAADLLSCVQDRIKTEPADFVRVVDILESEPTLTRQARQLVDSYRKCYRCCNRLPLYSLDYMGVLCSEVVLFPDLPNMYG